MTHMTHMTHAHVIYIYVIGNRNGGVPVLREEYGELDAYTVLVRGACE